MVVEAGVRGTEGLVYSDTCPSDGTCEDMQALAREQVEGGVS